MMRDPTAQTEPLTVGQQIVARWETDMIAEPCELAEMIDAAIAAEREACARIVDPPRSEPATPEARIASTVRKMFAEEIRSRKQLITRS